jgi:hypothetical protein
MHIRGALPNGNRQPRQPTLRWFGVCYVRAAVGGRVLTRWCAAPAPVALALVALVALAGCGGEDQSANERAGSYKVDVVRTSFPQDQHLAQQGRFVVVVRNAGRQPIPNLAVTLQGLTRDATQPEVADRSRPVWVVDDGPSGATSAYVDTWAVGRVEAGQTRRLIWRVTATTPGAHELRWRVNAGLDGRAQAVTSGGEAPEGRVTVRVSPKPSDSSVDPATGRVVRKY